MSTNKYLSGLFKIIQPGGMKNTNKSGIVIGEHLEESEWANPLEN